MEAVELPEKLILVMGETGVGKSTFVNEVTDSDMLVGDHIESCTTEVEESTVFYFKGFKLRLLDTPGYNDTYKTEAEILLQVARYLAKLHTNRRPIVGIIYLHNINHDRLPKEALNNFDLFRRTVGDTAAKNILVVTTQWDAANANKEKQNHCHQQLQKPEYFGKLVKPEAILKYEGKRYDHILEAIVNNPEVTLLIQNETVEQEKKLKDTAAGGIANTELNRELKDAKAELKKLKRAKSKSNKDKGKGKDKVMDTEMEKREREKEEVRGKTRDADIERLEQKINRLGTAQSAYKRKVEVIADENPQPQTQRHASVLFGKMLEKLKRPQLIHNAQTSREFSAGSDESQ